MTNWERIKNGGLDKNIFVARAKILRAIRDFFWSAGFLEVETPELAALPGQEPYLGIIDSEITDDRGKKYSASLITSPEYAMKKILAAGYEKIFQITKAFRNNESLGGSHNPEFTMLEWYRQNASYLDIMMDTESLVKFIAQETGTGGKIAYNGIEVDLSSPWKKMTVAEAMKKYADVDDLSYDGLVKSAEAKEYKIEKDEPYDSVFFKIFLNEIEPKFDPARPLIVYDYPVELGALARTKDGNPQIAERFEVYIGGLEIGNAFSELLDAGEQKKRFLEEQELRKKNRLKVYRLDEDFLTAIGTIKNPCGGIAVGVDRLVMLLTNQKDINNVLFFPAQEMFNK